jgi:hypothetical protein
VWLSQGDSQESTGIFYELLRGTRHGYTCRMLDVLTRPTLRSISSIAISTLSLSLACNSSDGAAKNPDEAGGAGSGLTAGASSGLAGTASGGTNAAGGGAASGGMDATSGGSASAAAAGSTSSAGQMGASAGGTGMDNPLLDKFSFFVTSLASIKAVSGNPEGFGGDLRFGEVGDGAGLRGADKICKAIAELGMPGAGAKQWRAFLSTTSGGSGGGPLHAKDRVGKGPWYDAAGRIVAMTLADLIGADRPIGADPVIRNDLPNEFGIPNHTADAPGCTGSECPDNHQVLTGTNCSGELYTGGGSGGGVMATCQNAAPSSGTPDPAFTCSDWTSKAAEGTPWCGHSWPRQGSGLSWMSSARDGGCAPCVRVVESGGVKEQCVGSAGGYGGFYCFVES